MNTKRKYTLEGFNLNRQIIAGVNQKYINQTYKKYLIKLYKAVHTFYLNSHIEKVWQ